MCAHAHCMTEGNQCQCLLLKFSNKVCYKLLQKMKPQGILIHTAVGWLVQPLGAVPVAMDPRTGRCLMPAWRTHTTDILAPA